MLHTARGLTAFSALRVQSLRRKLESKDAQQTVQHKIWRRILRLCFKTLFSIKDPRHPGPAARCWVGLNDAGEIVTQIQVDWGDAERGYIDLVVRPDLRGRGLGVAALGAFAWGPGQEYATLEGRIAPDTRRVENIAAVACHGAGTTEPSCKELRASADPSFILVFYFSGELAAFATREANGSISRSRKANIQ